MPVDLLQEQKPIRKKTKKFLAELQEFLIAVFPWPHLSKVLDGFSIAR